MSRISVCNLKADKQGSAIGRVTVYRQDLIWHKLPNLEQTPTKEGPEDSENEYRDLESIKKNAAQKKQPAHTGITAQSLNLVLNYSTSDKHLMYQAYRPRFFSDIRCGTTVTCPTAPRCGTPVPCPTAPRCGTPVPCPTAPMCARWRSLPCRVPYLREFEDLNLRDTNP